MSLKIDINDVDKALKFVHPLYELFCEFGREMNLGKEENKYYPLSGNAYRGKLKNILPLVEVWALKKYSMFIRFHYNTDGTVHTIEVAWEDLNEEEITEVLLNMYPKETNETLR